MKDARTIDMNISTIKNLKNDVLNVKPNAPVHVEKTSFKPNFSTVKNNFTKRFVLLLAVLFTTNTFAADLYWVGNTGNWNDASHWAKSSGGPGGVGVPSAADNVFFDEHSFDQRATVTIDRLAYANDVNISGLDEIPSFFAEDYSHWFIHGDLKMTSEIACDYLGTWMFVGNDNDLKIDLGENQLSGRVIFNGNGEWTLESNFELSGQFEIFHIQGTLNTNDKKVAADCYWGSDKTNCQLNLGNSDLAIATTWSFPNHDDITVSNTDNNVWKETKTRYLSVDPTARDRDDGGAKSLSVAVFPVTNQTCPGDCDGTATAFVTGDGGPYTYLWNDPAGQTTAVATGLCAGIITVSVTEGIEEAKNSNFIGPIPFGHGFINEQQPSCNAVCDGEVTSSASGATVPYTYVWPTGETTPRASALCAGNGQSLTITDGNLCVFVEAFNMDEPAVLVATANVSPTSCNGGNDGIADGSATTGGTTNYSYAWDIAVGAAQTANQTVTGLSPATYTFTVTDANGCTDAGTAIIGEPSNVSVTFVIENIPFTCRGDDDAEITATGAGGTAGYTYLWSTAATTQEISGLGAGTYNVTATDVNNCTVTDNTTIVDIPGLTVTEVVTTITCFNGTNGAINTTPSGGSAYFYLWSVGGQTTQDVSGLAPGTYNLTTTMNNPAGCTSVTSVTLTNPPGMTVTSVLTTVTCNGGSDGQINVSVTGGATPYDFVWTTGGLPGSLNTFDQTASALSAGTYTLQSTDNIGCSITEPLVILEQPAITPNVTMTHPVCSYSTIGTANSNPIGSTRTSYTYLWTTGATTKSVTGLAIGSHTVTVTDAKACVGMETIVITATPALSITMPTTNNPLSCFGDANAEVTATPAGGTPNFTYTWSVGGQTTATVTGLTAGAYNVSVLDANLCTITGLVTITEPTQLTITAAITSVTCNGGNDGQINATITGGTTAYGYQWSTGATTQNTSGLAAGVNYALTVTDGNGCVTITSNITVVEPAPITVTPVVTSVTCNGMSDGAITVTAVGGESPYNFVWTGGILPSLATTDQIETGLSAATFTMTATDVNGCIEITPIPVLEQPALATNLTVTHPLCANAATGIGATNPSGTTSSGYTYTWSDGQTTQNATGLSLAGGPAYSVTVLDVKGCSVTDAFILTSTDPLALTITPVGSPVACNGDLTGAVNLTVTGGQTNYTYLWSNAAVTPALVAVGANTYGVTVTDDNGCTIIGSTTITEPPAMTVTTVVTSVTCEGGSDGSVVSTVTGGTTAYNYLWSNTATTSSITGLAQGNFALTVTDGSGCISVTNNLSITEPNRIIMNDVMTTVTCNGGSDGQIVANMVGGAPPYNFLWCCALPPEAAQTTHTVTGLSAQVYNVTITDAKGCTEIIGKSVPEPGVPAANVTIGEPSCLGFNDGTATANPNNSTRTLFTYAWSTGQNGAVAAASHTATGLSTGGGPAYTVTVTDTKGCSGIESFTVTEPTALAVAVVNTSATCNALCDGTGTATASGATSPYTFVWGISGGGTIGTTSALTGACANSIVVTVTDNNGCVLTGTTTITQPTAVTLTQSNTSVTCQGGTDGTYTVSATGGETPYSFIWATTPAFATTTGLTSTATGLQAGVQLVTVTDDNSCNSTASTTIIQPTAITVSTATVSLTCNSVSTGQATVTATGGETPYTYNWDVSVGVGQQADQTVTGLAAGVYPVTVTDGNACVTTTSATVIEPTPILPNASIVTPEQCVGSADAVISAAATGGDGTAYAYVWSNAATTATVSGIAGGAPVGLQYTVTATDNLGCLGTETITVTSPVTLAVTATANPATCGGVFDGSATAGGVGGAGGYTYLWSDPAGQTTAVAAGLGSNVYTVTATDGNGCIAQTPITVTNTISITVNTTITNESCLGTGDGSVVAAGSGGVGTSYSYAWSSGEIISFITGKGSGQYCVTVTDNGNGCLQTHCVTVSDGTTLLSNINTTDVTCNGFADGTATANPSGAATPFVYNWSTGATTAGIGPLVPGPYQLTITDNNGCGNQLSTTITQPQVLDVSITDVNVLCNGLATGTVNTTVTGGTTAYNYVWSNASTTANLANVVAGGYIVTVTDANGCIDISNSTTITQPSAVTVTTTVTNNVCFGAIAGQIATTASGGQPLPAYTYLWSNGQNGATATALIAGVYTATITDGNACITTITETITEPGNLSVTTAGSTVSCNGGGNGTVNITVTGGGTTAYSYLWNTVPASTTTGASGLTSGTYTVTVTDGNACEYDYPVIVTAPTVLTVSPAAVSLTCAGVSTGSVTSNAGGGTTGYTYLWSNAATTANITGLATGNYDVTVTDDNGCTVVGGATNVAEPTALTITVATSVSTCNNPDGQAVATATGGAGAPYAYLWASANTTNTETGLLAGAYVVTATDANGCPETQAFNISDLGAETITLPLAITTVTCNGTSTGAVTVTNTCANAPCVTIWKTDLGVDIGQSGGGITTSATSLAAGDYVVSITNALGCLATEPFTIAEPTPVTLGQSLTHLTCNGTGDGSIALTAGGGVSAYTYAWTASVGVAQTANATVTGLNAGAHDVTVSDGNNCSIVGNYTITEPAVLTVTAGFIQNIQCNGSTDGRIDAAGTGGTTPYTYEWVSNCAAPAMFGTGISATGLAGGTYQVTITDASGCEATSGCISITEPGAVTVTGTSTLVSCNGGNDGTATAAGVGGTGIITYAWDAATGNQIGAVANTLSQGNYVVTATDANLCEATTTVTVAEPPVLTVTGATSTQPTCAGGTDATATLNGAGGGTTAYSYAWSTGATTVGIAGINAGPYSVTLTDANGCSLISSTTVTDPAGMVIVGGQTMITCNGGTDGAANVTVTGGITPYAYNWSTAATTQGITGQTNGTYRVTITENNGAGCSAIEVISITQPSPLLTTVNVTPSGCGAANGIASAAVTGGTTAYNFNWSSGGSTVTETGLLAGAYIVTVTDNNGCSNITNYTVTDIAADIVTVNVTAVTCNGLTDGTATASSFAGGTAPQTYIWNDGQTTQTAVGLSAGAVSVTVTNGVACETIAANVITEPSAITTTLTANAASCNGATDGSVSSAVSGGTTAYAYAWSTGATTTGISGLAAGTYDLSITDGAGCTDLTAVTITEPDGMAVTATPTAVLCNGDATGNITTVVTGGTTPYNYVWTGGQTTSNAVNLAAAVYNLTVTDNNGCNITTTGTVSEPAVLNTTVTVVNSTCGAGNGSATAAVGGGVTNYSYLWTSGNVSNLEAGLGASSISLTVTDGNGCTDISPVIITDIGADNVTVTINEPTCNGDTDGGATVTVDPAGTTPHTYLWSNASTTTATGGVLGAGPGVITVTNGDGCRTVQAFTITEPGVIDDNEVITQVTINGANDGTITLAASGSNSVYVYTWDATVGAPQVNNAAVTGLAPGTYCVTITANGGACSGTFCHTITEPLVLSVNTSVTDVNCFGGADGTVIAVGVGGVSPYNFVWSTGQTTIGAPTSTMTGLAFGTVDVTVTDQNGAIDVTNNILVNQPASGLAAAVAIDNHVSCNGGSDGAASPVLFGGTAPFGYLWGTGVTTTSASNLSAGTINLTVTDGNGCEAIAANNTITEPGAISVTFAVTATSCNGNCDGASDAVASGGTGAYTYLWSDFTQQTNAMATALCAGNYVVTVTDANGCTNSFTTTITAPSAITATTSFTSPTACTVSDGTATVSAGGGVGGFTYNWTDGQTTTTAVGLAAGLYTVTVTDGNGCLNTFATAVTDLNAPTVTLAVTDVTCADGNDGSIDASATGGTSPYTYLWVPTGETSEDIFDIEDGNYMISVTDALSCVSFASANVSEGAAISVFTGFVPADCGQTNGEVSAFAVGSHTYEWSTNNSNTGTGGSTVTGLAGGVYEVVVTNGNGCSVSKYVNVMNSDGPVAATTGSTPVACANGNNGTASINFVSGGASPYSYFWVGTGQTTATATGLLAGTHTVQVIDNNNCQLVQTVAVAGATIVTDSTAITPASCGLANGMMVIQPSGGTPPYTYNWSTGGAGATVTGLASESYQVTVTDNAGCPYTFEYAVSENQGPAIRVTVTHTTCAGGASGSAIAAADGVGPYDFLWSNGDPTAAASNLSAGTATVTVTDNGAGCVGIKTVNINEPSPLIAAAPNVVDPLCNGDANGTGTVQPLGGGKGYGYDWGPVVGATTATATGLSAGTYVVTITDGNACSGTSTVVVGEPMALTITADSVDVACNGNNTGEAVATATGGTMPYTYLWSNAGTTQTITGLVANTYTVTLTDANGCTIITNTTVTQPSSMTVTATSANISCFGQVDGTGNVSSTGGTPYVVGSPYTYAWSTGGTTNSITGLAVGTYSVTVSDSLGCADIQVITITEPAQLAAIATASNLVCAGAEDGGASVAAIGGVSPYSYNWNPGGGNNDAIAGLEAGSYCVTVTDFSGCTTVDCAIVTEPAAITATVATTEATCGECNGTATAAAGGGTAPFVYQWSNGNNGTGATDLCAGVHEVLVTDLNGCTNTFSTGVSNSDGPTAISTLIAAESCYGSNDGSATVNNVVGGASPYSYYWLPSSQTTATATGLSENTNDFVQVTDANGCALVQAVTITSPGQLTDSVIINNTTCGGNNGSITIHVSGGTSSTFTGYNWSTTASTQSVQGLGAGIYSVTVNDVACSEVFTYAVQSSSIQNANGSITDVSCFGQVDGSITVGMKGGTTPYTYVWAGAHPGIVGATTASITGLLAGDYTVTITDGAGCESAELFTVDQPDVLNFGPPNNTDPSCFGFCDGDAVVMPVGGTLPYSFAWDVGGVVQASATATALCDGRYEVTITDGNGCTTEYGAVMVEPTELLMTNAVTDARCEMVGDGAANVTVTGGTTPYAYNWSNAGTTSSIANLFPMDYSVSVTDANACLITLTMPVDTTIVVSALAVQDTAVCADASTIQVYGVGSATGFTGSLNNTWTDTSGVQLSDTTTLDQVALPVGEYQYVYVADDGFGCFGTDTITVVVNPLPDVEAGPTLYLPPGTDSGVIGGSPLSTTAISANWSPQTYIDDTAAFNPTVNPEAMTSLYFVTVTDVNGCTATDSVQVDVNKKVVYSGLTPNGDGNNDTWTIPFKEKYPDMTVEIFNRWGEQVFFSVGYDQPWDGIYQGSPLPVGTYYYVINFNHDEIPEPVTGPITIVR